jgi:cytoskeletal protein CcmA (bactofilin family)
MEEQFVNSIIGHHSVFRGDIELDGLFRIDGDFTGSIKTNGKVLLGNSGRADCTVDARIVVLGGIFKGTVYASDRVVLLSTAVVIGSIYAPRLIAEEGVVLEGSVMVVGQQSDSTRHEPAAGQGVFRLFKRRQSIRRRSQALEPVEENELVEAGDQD